ncbi:hypothetical protein SAMN06265378_102341 [Paracoccus sediminis]|uniref:Uncharacterized protein n=1 Tax=Paracoccus sediminis TaxID=1214787 RepID=A0A238VJS9_9RHOB|nr:hypothetical protein SAMN06265378_102341 [Paracoccus sediminis]
MRFQQGVCDSPARSAVWAIGRLASFITAAAILRSIRSGLAAVLSHLPKPCSLPGFIAENRPRAIGPGNLDLESGVFPT